MTDSPDDVVGAFREALIRYLNDAKDELTKHDDLEPVLLLGGSRTLIQVEVAAMPEPQMQAIVRSLCTTHPDIDHVFHISMAYTVGMSDECPAPENISAHRDARMQLIAHGSHRDLGFFAAHVTFNRKAANEFEFGEIEWPDPTLLRKQGLYSMWGKRHLNS